MKNPRYNKREFTTSQMSVPFVLNYFTDIVAISYYIYVAGINATVSPRSMHETRLEAYE